MTHASQLILYAAAICAAACLVLGALQQLCAGRLIPALNPFADPARQPGRILQTLHRAASLATLALATGFASGEGLFFLMM